MQTATRTRTVTWEDPVATAATAPTMTGLEFLQAMGRGEVPPPPFILLLGLERPEVGYGHATFTLPPDEHLYNPIGSVHGGAIASLLDTALGCAVHSTLPAGVGYASVDLSVTFLRPITRDTGLLRCTGEVIHTGRRIATARAEIVDEHGKRYATATTTCMIFGGES